MSSWYTGYGNKSLRMTDGEIGDLYLDNSNQQVYQFDGCYWILISDLSSGIISTPSTIKIVVEKGLVVQLTDNRFVIRDISLENREIYVWLLNSNISFKVIEDTIPIDGRLELEFDNLDDALLFKMTWYNEFKE